jgi:hypothetical protein
MRWFLIMLVVGVALFLALHGRKSEAYEAYLRFDEARREGNCGKLAGLVSGNARAWLDKFCEAGSGGDALAGASVLAMGTADDARISANLLGGLNTLQQAASVTFAHKEVDEDKNDDGSVTVKALCFAFDAHNDPGNHKLMPPKRLHTLRFQQKGEQWLVMDFKDDLAPAD